MIDPRGRFLRGFPPAPKREWFGAHEKGHRRVRPPTDDSWRESRMLRLEFVMSIIAVVVAATVAACGPASQVEESASPVQQVHQSEDVRDRIVGALQQPGMITRVEYDSQVVAHGLVTFEPKNVAWIDVEHDIVRLETGNPPTILLITADGEATFRPQDNSLSESPRRDPGTPSYPPAWSDKESINALGPLGVALNYGEWGPPRLDEEDDRRQEVWKVQSLPQNDSLGKTSMEVRIDAATHLPITAAIIPERTPTDTQVSLIARYRVEFVRPDRIAKDLFDLDAVRDLPFTFGGQLDSARTSEFPVYWLGRTASVGDPFPALTMSGFQLQPGDLDRATLDYKSATSAPGQLAGNVSMVQWPRAQFDSILFYGGPQIWWSGMNRVAAVIDGAPAEYAILDTTINPPEPVYPSRVPVPPPIPPGPPGPPPVPTPTPTEDGAEPVPSGPSRTIGECVTVVTVATPAVPLEQGRAPVTPPVPTPTPTPPGAGADPSCTKPSPTPYPIVATVTIDSRPRRIVLAMVWLPSTVISIEATPMWHGDEGRDANVFNSSEGVEAVIRALREIK